MSPEFLQAYRSCRSHCPFTAAVADHDHFLHCCHRHGLIAELFENIQAFGHSDAKLKEKLALAYRALFLSYAQYRTVLDGLDQAMAERSIEVVLLKGAALWFTCYQEHPLRRHVSDIDLLVRAEQRDALISLLEHQGFTGEHSGKTFKDTHGRIIDLHSGSLGIAENSSGITTDAIWQGAVRLQGFQSLHVMDPALETHYLALHALKHSYLRFTWLTDVVLSYKRLGGLPLGTELAKKVGDWSLYLYELLVEDRPSQRGLSRIERYLAAGMLHNYRHPLGKLLVALYQPGFQAKAQCLSSLVQRSGDRSEGLGARLVRLLLEAGSSVRRA